MVKKLYKLKKWLTLEETAKRLSTELEDEITVADVLQLAIDKVLRISVNFPHDWCGKVCEITTDETIVKQSEKEILGLNGDPFIYSEYEQCSETEYLKIMPDIRHFKSGIWELKLIGNEKIDLEWQLKEEKDLPTVDIFNLSGFYVRNKEGIIIERHTHLYSDEYVKLQKEIRNDFKQQLAKATIPDSEKLKIRENIDNKEFKISDFYYPCVGIGEIEGAFFVVQTEHINEFLNSLGDDEPSNLSLDSALYLLAEVINAVKSKNKKWTQSAIIDEILTQRQGKSITGLEQRTIEEYFSTANKRLKAK